MKPEQKQFIKQFGDKLIELFEYRIVELKEKWAITDDPQIQEEAWKSVQENKEWISKIKRITQPIQKQTEDTGI